MLTFCTNPARPLVTKMHPRCSTHMTSKFPHPYNANSTKLIRRKLISLSLCLVSSHFAAIVEQNFETPIRGSERLRIWAATSVGTPPWMYVQKNKTPFPTTCRHAEDVRIVTSQGLRCFQVREVAEFAACPFRGSCVATAYLPISRNVKLHLGPAPPFPPNSSARWR